jgi:hypothetical protein
MGGISMRKIFVITALLLILLVAFVGCENLTINGYAGSYVEIYAKEKGISFEEIDWF